MYINGSFQGRLISQGSLIVGPKALITIREDHKGLQFIVIKGGSITGNISAEKIICYENSRIIGDITCKSFHVKGSNVTLRGNMNINLFAPEMIDENGDIIVDNISSTQYDNDSKDQIKTNEDHEMDLNHNQKDFIHSIVSKSDANNETLSPTLMTTSLQDLDFNQKEKADRKKKRLEEEKIIEINESIEKQKLDKFINEKLHQKQKS